jgi:hypothetical protein
VQETFERTQHHLAEAGVDLKQTPLTLGQTLTIAPGKEQFLDHPAANALLTRDYRAPFVLPTESDL